MKVSDLTRKVKIDKRRARAEAARKGTVRGTRATTLPVPVRGVKRYIITSAQNNTKVNEGVWASLQALARHHGATIIVGTFSYDQNKYRAMSVKRGKEKDKQDVVWYDARVEPFIKDERLQLAPGLTWCGEMNILPTMERPLTGLESYTGRSSAIFPHAKLAMRSVATMLGEGTKLNYTTGAVTLRNYVAKRAGLIAEHHHAYGGLLVEVNADGNWWVRQLNADSKNRIQDLDVVADSDEVTIGNPVEAITWGDLHATAVDEVVVTASLDMLDALRPQAQFIHDVLEGSSVIHHERDNPHFKFYNWLRGLNSVEEELKRTVEVVNRYLRPDVATIVVDSNHDDPWIQRWLREYDYRKDPRNSELFLRAQVHLYAQLRAGKMPRDVNMLGWCLKQAGLSDDVKFLVSDESYLICNRQIECGMHGHLGPGGKFGTPEALSRMGRKANTAHTHTAGIYNGLYVAGTSAKLRWDYNRGPSGWTHSHIVTYPNGKRAIVTIYNGGWRA
jgi:hypothetical protein